MIEAIRGFMEWLHKEDDFLIISHVSPDGDTIGSGLALYGILLNMNKKVRICCDQPVPRVYRFLPWADAVEKQESILAPQKNVIAVDCADILRMGYAKQWFEAAEQTGNIDHHITNALFGTFNLHHAGASATGELVFLLWEALDPDFAKRAKARQIATCLFAAICTDTGSFAYANVTPETFRIAARLLELGIDIATIHREIYGNVPIGRTRLKGFVLNHIELYADGRIAIVGLYQSDIESFGTSSEDVEGMIDYLRSVDTVEIAILFREARDNSYKVSFRSKRYADVSELANQFGGGGHVRAAGCTIAKDISMTELKSKLIDAALKALE